eukprot:1339679-Pleurochrysis_carterae.AAC.1
MEWLSDDARHSMTRRHRCCSLSISRTRFFSLSPSLRKVRAVLPFVPTVDFPQTAMPLGADASYSRALCFSRFLFWAQRFSVALLVRA